MQSAGRAVLSAASNGLLTIVAIRNLTVKHSPWDIWFSVLIGLLWIPPLITAATALARPALLRRPPLSSDAKVIAIPGAVLLPASLLAPMFLLPDHTGTAVFLAVAGCALSFSLLQWARRRTDRAESTGHPQP